MKSQSINAIFDEISINQYSAKKWTRFKIVRIKDRYLGMLYWGIVCFVIMYIIIVALLMEGFLFIINLIVALFFARVICYVSS